MVIGHNPGLEDLVEQLSGDHHTMPTAAIAYFDLEIKNWNAVGKMDDSSLIDVWRPKEID